MAPGEQEQAALVMGGNPARSGWMVWNISHHGFLMHPAPSFHYLA
jgi:hypothetical protein